MDDQSHAYGLIQWCGSAARACLYNWCTANNCDPDTLDGQTKCIVAQIKGINLDSEKMKQMRLNLTVIPVLVQ